MKTITIINKLCGTDDEDKAFLNSVKRFRDGKKSDSTPLLENGI